MKIGTSQLLDGYERIYMLNGYSMPDDKSTVFKYMPLERFVQSVEKKQLVFVNPETWYDPFEQLYHGIDCSIKGYKCEDIACMCVSEKSSTNEDASWRVYAGSNNKTVRLSIEKTVLFALLDDYAKHNDYHVYIGKVNYTFDKNEIMRLHEKKARHHQDFFPKKMKREHYLSVMLLKRKAFSYENEVRIFLVKDNISFDNKLVKIDCDYKANRLVSNVMLSPYPPIREKDDIAYNARKKINTMESKEIKSVLKSMLGCRIQQSLLYKVYPKISFIN